MTPRPEKKIITDSLAMRDFRLIEINGGADHVHILFEADPVTSMGEFVSTLKTRTSRLIRKKYGSNVLAPYYWKPYFWAQTYFIGTVGEQSVEAVRNYIKNQTGE